MVLAANSSTLTIFKSGEGVVFCSNESKMKEALSVRSTYSGGRFSTYGRAFRVYEPGMLIYLTNNESKVIILPLLQFENKKKEYWGDNDIKTIGTENEGQFIEFDYSSPKLYSLKEDGCIVVRGLKVKFSHSKSLQEVNLAKESQVYSVENHRDDEKNYYSCIKKISNQEIISVAYKSGDGYAYFGIKLLFMCGNRSNKSNKLGGRFDTLDDRKVKKMETVECYPIHMMKSVSYGRIDMLIACAVYKHIHIYIINQKKIHVVKEYHEFDASYFNNFEVIGKSIFVAGFKYINRIDMNF